MSFTPAAFNSATAAWISSTSRARWWKPSPLFSRAKFLENKGEGFHHLALEVEDIHAAVAELKAAGVKLIDETPREGAHGALVAFLHPKATFGLLVELCQYPD